RLRALWALHVTNLGQNENVLDRTLEPDPHVRAWMVQLALETRSVWQVDISNQLAGLAMSDPSPVVRLYLASRLQRIAPNDRWKILEGLLSHSEDAKDQNLPLMYWYAAEPLATEDAGRALDLAARSKVPMLEFMARRVGAIGTPEAISILV